jgi:hypothetical protein
LDAAAPQTWGAVQLPQSAERGSPQLSVPETVWQLFPSRAQNSAFDSGVQLGSRATPAPAWQAARSSGRTHAVRGPGIGARILIGWAARI